MTTRRSFIKLIAGAVIAKSLVINAAVSDFTTEIQDGSSPLVVNSTNGFAVGDVITIGGVRVDGAHKRFRIVSVDSGEQLTVAQV